MPIINVSLPQGALKAGPQAQLIDELTQLLLKWKGGADNPRSQHAVWTFVNEFDRSRVAVGGQMPADGTAARYRIVVTVPQGSLSDEAKNGLVGEVTQAVLSAEGAPTDLANSLRVYCLIDEVPDGNWGTAGRILRLKDMAALSKAT